MPDEKALAEFRKRLIEDQAFRHEFAKDPTEALRTVGIDVPEGAYVAPIDAAELDARVDRIKAILGSRVNELYTSKNFGKLVRDRATFKRVEHASAIASRVGGPFSGRPGTVYTISAFGTIDW
jgi:hypothetical protein